VAPAAPITLEGATALAITGLALLLFIWNRYRADVVALGVLVMIVLSGILTPAQAIAGFAHEATITVALMLVLGAGLLRTGAVAVLARHIGRLAGKSELRLLVIVIAVVLPLSAIINNTAAVAVLLPMVMGLTRTVGTTPSRLLMPLSFASQLGGTLTLIGTSTNLLVAGLALELGVPRIQLFDITAPAAILALAGAVYLLTVGRWLLPHRVPETNLLERYELHDYLGVLRVRAGSALAGRSLAEARFGASHGLQVMLVERGERRISPPSGSTVLQAGDLLLVEGKVAELARVQHGSRDLEVADAELTQVLEADADPESGRFAEVLVPARARAIGRTTRELGLRARFGVSALAVRRHGTALPDAVGEVRLQAGDMLLVRGTPDALNRLRQESELVLLGELDVPRVRPHRMRLAVSIVAGVVLLPALGIVPILVSALVGVLAMLVTGCIQPDEAYREVDWMVIVLLGAILPLGEAMHRTGAAGWLAQSLLLVGAPLGPHGLLAGLLLLTTALTSIISNAAAGAVLAPVAVAMAAATGMSPLPLVIGIMIGASNSFLSPVGYQTNAMIYTPGGYRFSDYLRVGGPLSLLIVALATVVIPVFFPF
jgi:di/tricarboxylate transporter